MNRIFVKWTAMGFHYWPGAVKHPHRKYLADRHRHLFHFRVEMDVMHDDRDVEFHDVLQYCKFVTSDSRDYGPMSCEAIARMLLERVNHKWPDRNASVTVSEDNECGATVS